MFDKFHEECGVVAIYGHPEASKLAYLGLYALQHRGQESAGICTTRRRPDPLPQVHGPRGGHLHQPGAGDAAGRTGHRPHALLHRRRHGAAQRAAVFGGLQQGARGGGAQRQHHQRRGTARANWSGAAPSSRPSATPKSILHLVAHSSERTLAGALRDALLQLEGAFSLVFLARRPHHRGARSARLPPAGDGRDGDFRAAASATCSPRKPARST